MAAQIKFGTSGWRAVTAEEFTFANVYRAVHGVARYVLSQKSNGAKINDAKINDAKIIVGRDPRFLGENFCATAPETLSSYRITPLLCCEMVARRSASLGKQLANLICSSWFLLSTAGELPLDGASEREVN
jgi:phosphomannomutase